MDTFSQYICGSKLWDPNLTWYSNSPDFTVCFEETALVWIPILFLWMFSCYEIHRIVNSSCDQPIPWSALNVTQITLSLVLVVLSFCDLMDGFTSMYYWPNTTFPVSYITPILKIVTFIEIAFILYYNRIKGLIRSVVLFIFWLLMSISSVIMCRSLYLIIFSKEEYDGTTDDIRFGTKILFVSIVFIQFILSCFVDPTLETQKNTSPQSSASVLSLMTFWWINPLIFLGYKRALTSNDLWQLSEENTTKYNSKIFNERLKQKHITNKLGILWPILQTYRLFIVLMFATKLILSFMPYFSPLVLNWLIDYMSADSTEPVWRGYLYAIIMFVSPMIESLIQNNYKNLTNVIDLRIRSCITNAIYKKSLRLSSAARNDFTIGQIINLMSIDTPRLAQFAAIVNETWSGPIQIIFGMYLLWQQLGVASIAGLGAMILMIPANGYMAGKLRFIVSRLMKCKDRRIKLMNEILCGIKVLKLYAWESSFDIQVTHRRNDETKLLTSRAYVMGVLIYIFYLAPYLVAVTSFATFLFISSANVLTPQKAFVSLALFNQMRFPLKEFPQYISYYAMFSVSLNRINKFMSGDEIDPKSISHDRDDNEAIVIEKASFCWDKSQNSNLSDISLTIPKKSLTAIVGQVGAGKSSLLCALLGDMFKVKGRVNISGTVAYVPQQTWIQNASLKQNIIYTNHPNDRKLYEIMDNCALLPDLDVLPGGVNTEIGENGINLSGGQKQRVSIARACYSSSDIYLFDDPLSALDANVVKHVFDRVIGPNGILKDKTRLLVTHRLSVLSKCDQIIVIKDGLISESGSYKQLLENRGDFADLLISYINEQKNENMDEEELQLIDEVIIKNDISRQISETKSSERSLRHRTVSDVSNISADKKTNESKDDKQKANKMSKLIEEEKSETGSVKLNVYSQYLSKVGLIGVGIILLAYIGSTSFDIASSQWLALWSDDSNDPKLVNDNRLRNVRLGIYALLGSGESIFILIVTITVNLAAIRGARLVHNDMIDHIFRAPMLFFDTTPMGRVLNRFAHDIDILDANLDITIRVVLTQTFRALSVFVVMAIEIPIVMMFILPIGFIYLIIQRLYIPTSRQLRRIESTTRSPIYSHFSETLSGATSIRAYGSVNAFIDEFNNRVDLNNMSSYMTILVTCWLSIRIEFLGYLIIFINALYAVIYRGSLSPGVVGLTLSYSMQITRALTYLVESVTRLETQIVSVERCLEYTNIPTEALYRKPECRPVDGWPQNGCITFENYSTRYRDGLDLVLNNISLKIKAGNRVGIVGRTGAGKSSLTLALFRLIEPAGGVIDIDGIDISTIGLYDLRSRLTIIPQDPVLFTGTIRLNLDPFDKHSDDELWGALELSHLKVFVESLNARLDHPVTEGGDNLSVGQKQLVCLSRALLRKSKVIVLDEATAAIDIETDDLIQTTIRTEFNECTIITIAHRLNTILDYDMIVVINNGKIAEYDSPQELIKDHNSLFYSLAKDSGHI